MVIEKLRGIFSRRLPLSIEEQKYELRVKARHIGLHVVEENEMIDPMYYKGQIHPLFYGRLELQTASTDSDNEKLSYFSIEQLEMELIRIMRHSYTLLRALSWSVQKSSINTHTYASTVTELISDTLHNAPGLLQGKLYSNDNDGEHKCRLISIIQEYRCLLIVLEEHLVTTKLDEKVRHDIRRYYGVFSLTDIKGLYNKG